MYLTRHLASDGARWAADGRYLIEGLELGAMLRADAGSIAALVAAARTGVPADAPLLPPIDHGQEVWASGVTYLRSREARVVEAETKDIYEKVYDAERVEVFFKAIGWRAVGHGQPIRVRRDSRWNVPEPELTLVVNHQSEIVGYCAGNDVSSRDIEGENPLYLPQAKVYDGSCAIGPGIMLADAHAQRELPIRLTIERAGTTVFEGETSAAALKRSLEEIVAWLTREHAIPNGIFLMTGTGIVPPDDFSLTAGDEVGVRVGDLVLRNPVR